MLDRAIVGQYRIEVVAPDEQLADRNAKGLDALHCFELGASERLAKLAPAVREEA